MTSSPPQRRLALSDQVLREICQIVYEMCGNHFDDRQKATVENRLRSRMLKLQIDDGDEYLSFLRNHMDSEGEMLLSLLTTHHTFFFREFPHFEFLLKQLPHLIEKARFRPDRKIQIWSTACSFGHEVYSLATFLETHLREVAPDVSYEILGSDVDPQSIKIAKNGVYKREDLKVIPRIYLGDFWIRGTGEIKNYAKIRDDIKAKCRFEVFNLVKPDSSLIHGKFDIIFCRNVFIYFHPQQIIESTKYLLDQLADSGYFFVGVSESLTSFSLDMEHLGPAIYQKKPLLTVVDGCRAEPDTAAAPAGAPLRVLCVDDSMSILLLLKKILQPSEGFEVVGTASNGREAAALLKTLPVDLVTLDIHMPEVDGLTYLEKHMDENHPPVVMISSVQRDNADMAFRALELGAADYVEKPTLANLEDRGEEIRAKLRTAYLQKKAPLRLAFDDHFKRTYKISHPDKKARLVFTSLQNREGLASLVRDMETGSPPLLIILESIGELAPRLAAELSRTGRPVEVGWPLSEPRVGGIYVLDYDRHAARLKTYLDRKSCAIMLSASSSPKVRELTLHKRENGIFIEDIGASNRLIYGPLVSRAVRIIPLTSFMSVSEEFFE